MIEDRHMVIPRWNLQLKPTTTRQVRDQLRSLDGADDWRSFVVFFEKDMHAPDRIAATWAEKMAFIESAIYTGCVWERGGKGLRIGGPGLLGQLETDRGYAGEMTLGVDNPSWPANIAAIMNGWFGSDQNGIQVGLGYSYTADTVETLDVDTYLPPLKGPLDQVMAQTGNEYRVRPTGYIDYGIDTALFQDVPQVLLVEGGGRSENLRVPKVTLVDVNEDVNGYRNWGKAISSDGLSGWFGTDVTVPEPDVRGWFNGGELLFFSDLVTVDSTDSNDVLAVAKALGTVHKRTRRVITVSMVDECPLGYIVPGDWVYVSSPDDYVFNTGNEVLLDGQIIHPEEIRVVAIQQPFMRGMGAYVVRYNSFSGSSLWDITRITDYIEDEGNEATIELGSKPEMRVPDRYESYIDR